MSPRVSRVSPEARALTGAPSAGKEAHVQKPSIDIDAPYIKNIERDAAILEASGEETVQKRKDHRISVRIVS